MDLTATDALWVYVISLVVLLVLDAVWIGVLARGFYRRELNKILKPRPYMPAVFMLYAVLAASFAYFAVLPGIEAQSLYLSLSNGFILGAAIFGLYSLSTFSLINGWSRWLAVVDFIWGLALSLVTAGGTYLLFLLFFLD